MKKMKKEILLATLVMTISLFTSGYGYMGKLPVLGESAKPKETKAEPIVQPPKHILPAGSIVPRPNAGLRANRYNIYLTDIKEIDALLKDIKALLEEKRHDKVQLFCAKANLLNLYVDNFKAKYNGKPESYYESYKQLLILNKYLSDIVDYKLAIEKERNTTRGTLLHEQQDKKYLEQRISNSLTPVSTVIEIINDAG